MNNLKDKLRRGFSQIVDIKNGGFISIEVNNSVWGYIYTLRHYEKKGIIKDKMNIYEIVYQIDATTDLIRILNYITLEM